VQKFGIKIYCNKPFTLTRLDVETFPEIKRLPVRSKIALKKREAKIADSADALRTLKSTVIAATVSKSQTKEAEQMILDKSAKLLPIPERVFTKFLQSQNNKSKSQLSHEVGASSIYSHQLIKTGTDFEPLTHYERRKLEVKKRVRKYRAAGFSHYKPENYNWDVDDENNVSMIQSRSLVSIAGTKTWDPIGSNRESIANKIRDDTARAFVHLETVVWKER
jgi:hypothetical protein